MRILVLSKASSSYISPKGLPVLWTPWTSRCETTESSVEVRASTFLCTDLQGWVYYRPQQHFQYIVVTHLQQSLLWGFEVTDLFLQPKKLKPQTSKKKKTSPQPPKKERTRKPLKFQVELKKIYSQGTAALSPSSAAGRIQEEFWIHNSKQISGHSLGCNKTNFIF